MLRHDGDYIGGLSAGVEIKVIAEVGPVIERLDDDDVADLLQGIADGSEKGQRVLDALALFDDCLIRPLRAFVPGCGHSLMQPWESAGDYVVGICQAPELIEILSSESGNDRGNICVSHGIGEGIVGGSQEQLGEQG
jgi:hypothetical protein